MKTVFCTVIRADSTNVVVLTHILFHCLNNVIKFDVLVKEHCLSVYNSGILLCFK